MGGREKGKGGRIEKGGENRERRLIRRRRKKRVKRCPYLTFELTVSFCKKRVFQPRIELGTVSVLH